MAQRPRAAVLLIGNELLSGKIRDENGWFLSQVCRRRGLELREIAVVPDEIERIGAALLRLLADVPLVFTSGGVGPTHDDVTMEAIARATGRALVRDEAMADLLRAHYRGRETEAAMRMADVPEGTELRALPGWPVLRLDLAADQPPSLPHDARVYILPGIPALLRAKIEALENLDGELPARTDWVLAEIHTKLDESALAPFLDAVVAAHPSIEIGSYPRWQPGADGRLKVRVKVTLEGPTPAAVEAAREALLAVLDPAVVLPES